MAASHAQPLKVNGQCSVLFAAKLTIYQSLGQVKLRKRSKTLMAWIDAAIED